MAGVVLPLFLEHMVRLSERQKKGYRIATFDELQKNGDTNCRSSYTEQKGGILCRQDLNRG